MMVDDDEYEDNDENLWYYKKKKLCVTYSVNMYYVYYSTELFLMF